VVYGAENVREQRNVATEEKKKKENRCIK